MNDGIVFSGSDLIFSPWATSEYRDHSSDIALIWKDITYSIASIWPTDSINNQIKLDTVMYTSGSTTIDLALDRTPLEFLAPFTSSLALDTPPVLINQDNRFTFTIQDASMINWVMNPSAISFLTIGDTTRSSFINFSSTPSEICSAFDMVPWVGHCSWLDTAIPGSSNIVFQWFGTYTFTGKYEEYTPPIIPESVSYMTYITGSYALPSWASNPLWISPKEFAYLASAGSLGASSSSDIRIKMIGNHNNLLGTGAIDVSRGAKAEFINTIRKNIATLSRNRTDYSDVAYSGGIGDISVNDAYFSDKRVIWTIGGDITITSGIDRDPDHPLAIIALADANGVWGHIIIQDTVTDIHATLISEKSIRSSGNRQLYIGGSVISSNTIGGSVTNICPFYLSICTAVESRANDLDYIRDGYFLTPLPANAAINTTAVKYQKIPLIIEYDMRVMQDPPPGLEVR
jgi:hypothetical protein